MSIWTLIILIALAWLLSIKQHVFCESLFSEAGHLASMLR